MQAVVAVCHFCESHGPRVVMTTQSVRKRCQVDCCGCPFSMPQTSLLSEVVDGRRDEHSDYFTDDYRVNSLDEEPRCMACSSFSNGLGICTNDPSTDICYISSQVAINERVYQLVKHACLRSLSCEISGSTTAQPQKSPIKSSSQQFPRCVVPNARTSSLEESLLNANPDSLTDGLILFGDDINGYTLSHTFRLKDAKARGFQRWFSLIILCMDKFLITNNYEFFVSTLSSIINGLQAAANNVFRVESGELTNNECLKQATASRASLIPAQFLRTRVTKLELDTSRSLSLITGDDNIFIKLHKQMIWLLRTQSRLCVENVLEGVPSQDALVQMELEPDEIAELDLVHTGPNDCCSLSHVVTLQHIAKIFCKLPFIRGVNPVDLLLTQLVQGSQVVVRCDDFGFTRLFLLSLSDLLPIGCIRWAYCEQYQYVSKFNLLGCPHDTEVPSDVTDALVISLILGEVIEKEFVPDQILDQIQIESPLSTSPLTFTATKTCTSYNDDVDQRDELAIAQRNEHLSIMGKIQHDFDRCEVTINAIPKSLQTSFPSVVIRYRQLLLDTELGWRVLESVIKNTREQWLSKAKLIYQLSRQKEGIDLKQVIRIVKCSDNDAAVLNFWQAGLSKVYKQHVLNTINSGDRLPM